MVIPRSLLSLALVAAIVGSSVSTVRAQAKIDPQSLIGEWTGKWVTSHGPGPRRAGGPNGPYALTIKQVTGDQVRATLDVVGQAREIRAKLVENRLTFGNDQFQTELTVDGDQMRGTRQGSASIPWVIELTKKK